MCCHVFLGAQTNANTLLICLHVSVCIYMFNPLLSGQMKSDLVREVAYTRRKQHQASLQYYCTLNALQYRKRIAMLEPMLGYTQAKVLSLPQYGTQFSI